MSVTPTDFRDHGLSRDEFRKMLQSVVANGHTFDECKEVLRNSALSVLSRIISSKSFINQTP